MLSRTAGLARFVATCSLGSLFCSDGFLIPEEVEANNLVAHTNDEVVAARLGNLLRCHTEGKNTRLAVFHLCGQVVMEGHVYSSQRRKAFVDAHG